ncbi:MAG: hypothetical protein AB7O39_09515 [Flavobacteriaceae bacterium]
MRAYLLSFIAVSVVGLPVLADPGPDENGRYLLQRDEGGFLRVDRQSGVASYCRRVAGAWSCTLVPDDLEAFEDEITRLNRQIDSLEKSRDELRRRIEVLEGTEREGGRERAPGAQAPEDGVDRTMNVFERKFRDFLAVIDELVGYFK